MFNQIPYDSDASAKTAVMNGECDFTVCKVQSGIEDWKAGDLIFLCMLAEKPVATMPDVPLITAEYPDFAKFPRGAKIPLLPSRTAARLTKEKASCQKQTKLMKSIRTSIRNLT